MPITEEHSPSLQGPELALVAAFLFLNTLWLPSGLMYTTLLTPLFLALLLWQRRLGFLFWYLLLTLPLAWFHLRHGADRSVYLRSYLLFTGVVIFSGWAYYFLKRSHTRLGNYFRYLTLYNALLTGVALIALLIPFLKDFWWSMEPVHAAIPPFPRLKMLVYEPSFYSLQLAPVFLFFFLSWTLTGDRRYGPGLALLSLSLLLSLSFGVIGGLLLAISVVFLICSWYLLRRRRLFFLAGYLIAALVLAAWSVWQFYPDSPLVDRLEFIRAGQDSSANGRTWEAFLLAWRILGESDYLFGAGLGQIKVVGHDIIVGYYRYQGLWADVVRIPNVMAETLATFGLVGVVVRLLSQIVLFVATGVYNNYYRMVLFAFLFIYQFTGSYLTNPYEYLFWVIVFLPVFPQFERSEVELA